MCSNVACHPDGLPKGGAIGRALPGNVKTSAVVGTRPNHWESGGEVDATAKAKGLERGEPLVVVHGQHTIELPRRP